MSSRKSRIGAGDPGEAIASSPGLVGSVLGGPPGGEAAHSEGRVVCGLGRSRRVCRCIFPAVLPNSASHGGGTATNRALGRRYFSMVCLLSLGGPVSPGGGGVLSLSVRR